MGRTQSTALGGALALAVLGGATGPPPETPPVAERSPAEEEPAPGPEPIPLIERAETRLAQIDVTVTGPAELVQHLGPEDFKLKVQLKRFTSFAIDAQCRDETLDEAAPGTAMRYLLYFDQPHLTFAGRARSIDVARELVLRLVHEGAEAMIVSNARRLAVVEEWTSDPERLRGALERLEHDRGQWDSFAAEEEQRVAQVAEALQDDNNTSRAIGTARRFKNEEQFLTIRDLRRLTIALAHLSEGDAHHAVILFADTLRRNPGEHYLSFFGPRLQATDVALGDFETTAFAAGVVFEQVLNHATAAGIRFYTVLAQGLVTPHDPALLSAQGVSRSGTADHTPRTRFHDAQDTLAHMARETGGDVFLQGEEAARIAESIEESYACLYTLSFDPTGLPQDVPLRATVEVTRPGVRARSRGRIVLPSRETVLVQHLLGAFTFGEEASSDFGLKASLVPSGFARGAYSALLQISVPEALFPTAEWELGASLIARDRVVGEVSGKLAVTRGGVPLVLEREVEIRPGPHRVAAVAREASSDFIVAEQIDLSWPDPDAQPVTCGPLALLQPTEGAFVREGRTRTLGSLARTTEEPVQAGLPTALMGLVCRDRKPRGPLRVERSIVGQAVLDFPPLALDFGSERCVQVRDLIPAGRLRPGGYRYLVRALADDKLVGESSREFTAVGPES